MTHILRFFPAATAALIFLFASGCNRRQCDLVGSWEGAAGGSRLALTLRDNGEASVSVTVDGQMSTTYCRWSRLDRRIGLTNTRGQVRWLAILSCGGDNLTLRIAEGRTGVCRLYRTDIVPGGSRAANCAR